MRMKTIAFAVAGAAMLPGSASAVQVAGELLEVYGKVHLSADFYDTDAGAPGGVEDESGYGLSSNSSRLGFKGKYVLDGGLNLLYQIEQEITLDEGGGDTFTTRNSYFGIGGGFGRLLAGYHDTPFKDLGGKYTIFGDTVADRRAILGAFTGFGNTMNDRGANAVLYVGEFGPVELKAMYAADAQGSSGAFDNNDEDLSSVSLVWENNGFSIGAAFEDQSNLRGGAEAQGLRVGAGGEFGPLMVQAIYESTESDDNDVFERDAYGANATFKVSKKDKIGLQWLRAEEYANSSDTGADMVSVGWTRKLDKRTSMYAVYTQTDNESNARYQGVDGGHGDEVRTDLGGTPSAFSLGLVFKF